MVPDLSRPLHRMSPFLRIHEPRCSDCTFSAAYSHIYYIYVYIVYSFMYVCNLEVATPETLKNTS